MLSRKRILQALYTSGQFLIISFEDIIVKKNPVLQSNNEPFPLQDEYIVIPKNVYLIEPVEFHIYQG